jgi:hypothetical protein
MPETASIFTAVKNTNPMNTQTHTNTFLLRSANAGFYRNLKIEPTANGHYKIYHSDGQLLILVSSKSEAIRFVDAYTDPTRNW